MAVRTISTKLAVDGEEAFKQAITKCNSQRSLLKSSLAATESEFRNNANSLDALRAKDEKLNALKGQVAYMETYAENIQKAMEMDVEGDAYKAGVNNMQGLINGAASQKAKLGRQYEEMGNAALAAYKRTVEKTVPWASQTMADSILATLRGVEYRPYSGLDGLLDPAAEAAQGAPATWSR